MRLQSELLGQLGSIPGVSRAGAIDRLPMSTSFRNGLFVIVKPGELVETFDDFQRLAEDPERVGEAEYRAASEGFFQAIGIPLLRGRLFEDRDDRAAPHVAVISESLARAKWLGQDPIGALIEFGNMDGDLRFLRVVGVGGDIRHGGLDTEARPTIYINARQRPPVSFTIVMDAGSPQSVMAAARRITQELAPDIPPRFSTMGEVFRGSIADRRFNLLLLSVFGASAFALAIMGIYGVISYGVTQRTQELAWCTRRARSLSVSSALAHRRTGTAFDPDGDWSRCYRCRYAHPFSREPSVRGECFRSRNLFRARARSRRRGARSQPVISPRVRRRASTRWSR
ncbi:MAG: hypothetical protein E2P02_01560 [Acidobacteria bacterium]|nr:MAG: hypothetical protein E2P02_01560 [Acidobacteriota bacterium]